MKELWGKKHSVPGVTLWERKFCLSWREIPKCDWPIIAAAATWPNMFILMYRLDSEKSILIFSDIFLIDAWTLANSIIFFTTFFEFWLEK